MLNLIKRVFRSLYTQYELVTCIYMFEPWEKRFINGLVSLILALVIFSSYFYLPSYIRTLVRFMSLQPLDAKSATETYGYHTS